MIQDFFGIPTLFGNASLSGRLNKSDNFAMLLPMAEKKFDRKTIEAQLNELGAQIRELLNKLETAVGKEAEALRPKLKAAQAKLHELKQTSAEAWEDLKPGLHKAWEELHKSLNQAASRFKTRSKQ
ncbi:MAG: coiled coil domain-containing protein [Acidobacteria bacterium]|nr:MAG: coiled coil domain-containing protein [Acidobacteriota bacterium]